MEAANETIPHQLNSPPPAPNKRDAGTTRSLAQRKIDTPQIQLSDEQVAEVDRRLTKKNPKTLTMAELDTRLQRRGV